MSAMLLAGDPTPGWRHALDVAGDVAGTVLVADLLLVLLLITLLMVGLAVGAWWVRRNLVPLLVSYSGQAENILATATRGVTTVRLGVAELHGWRARIKATAWSFVLGPDNLDRMINLARRTPPPPAETPDQHDVADVE